MLRVFYNFYKRREKKVPETFEDCYSPDEVTKELWSWSARLEDWGQTLFRAIIVIGIILAIVGAIMVDASGEIQSFNFWMLLTGLIECAIYAVIEYIIYHVLALLVGSLATIVQHTKISADVALYMSSKELGLDEEKSSSEKESPKE